MVINGKIQAPTDNRSTTVHPSLTLSAGEQVGILQRRERFFRLCYFMIYIALEHGGGACTVSASCVEVSVTNLGPNANRDFFVAFLQPSSRIVPFVRPLPVFPRSFGFIIFYSSCQPTLYDPGNCKCP